MLHPREKVWVPVSLAYLRVTPWERIRAVWFPEPALELQEEPVPTCYGYAVTAGDTCPRCEESGAALDGDSVLEKKPTDEADILICPNCGWECIDG
jgi:hypothetical protein